MKYFYSVLIPLLFLSLFAYPSCVWAEEEFIQVSAAIHINSTVSDGKYALAEITEIARLNKFQAVIFTDRDSMRWQYGLWPLRNIIKKTVESNSVFVYRPERYLNRIRRLQERNPDLVLIPGVESAPFYFWKGSPFNNTLAIHNWHRHMLLIGMEASEDYKRLPVVGNPQGLWLSLRFKDIYRFWPILVVLIGGLCLRKRQFAYKDYNGITLGDYSRAWQILGTVLIVLGLAFLINNYPFRGLKFDQYQGDLGTAPYQNFIDYANERGALCFWAHPEAEYVQKRGEIKIETLSYVKNLLKTQGYAGFTVFHEGYKQVGIPGGIWDEVLMQYCQDKRKAPVWAIAGLAFDQNGDLSSRMQNLRNRLLVPQLNKVQVLTALKKGRMYVLRGKQSGQFILDKFTIADAVTGNNAVMGQELLLAGGVRLNITGSFLDGNNSPVEIALIRDGKVIKVFEETAPFNVIYDDDYMPTSGQRSYYRLQIRAKDLIVITNPIFVMAKNA